MVEAFVPVKLLKVNCPETLALVPVALPKVRLVIVPTAVKFGKEVEAEIVRYVLEASAW